ncbi:MAG: hypothetical protein WCK34_15505, partial [Bacteroidota bacterium]
MKSYLTTLFFLLFLFPGVREVNSQVIHKRSENRQYYFPDRAGDSLTALRVPLLKLPEGYRNRSLPATVDNSQNKYWPGIKDQYLFYTCQQYCGVAYVFSYEMNRLRDLPGSAWENGYPPHYTWNFMNHGDRFTGVDFLQSFEAIKQQGHMTSADYGIDTIVSTQGWISGYDKYYRGMSNHIRQVYAIKTNSTEGILTLKNYLADHLDGSATGGIACFTTDAATLYSMSVLPAGFPEAGKHVVLDWAPAPDHGLTVVGYNDSIRFDINHDGKYTNNLDITGDGIVDARDWEIGAFKLANSYGTGWEDNGYTYALYRSFALNYEEGGVWNNRVYVVEPDTVYHPLLAFRMKLDYNLRDRIRVLAGVSADTTARMPEHVMDFPFFNYQGGEHVMQGWDTIPGAKTIEFGLDVTQLLNMVPEGAKARFFLGIEERDFNRTGNGAIRQASFISYRNGVHEFAACSNDVSIEDNAVTLVSAVLPVDKPVVDITTASLPPYIPSQPWQLQLAATGGTAPYDWSFSETYARHPVQATMPQVTGTSMVNDNSLTRDTAVVLPFSFPFYGKKYDTVFINYFGFVTFESRHLPGYYTTDEVAMLRTSASVAPAFSQLFTYDPPKNDGIFLQSSPQSMIIRWKVTDAWYAATSTNDFALILYPDGRIEFRYGLMNNQGFTQSCYTGISKGDDHNSDLSTQWNANDLSGKSFSFIPHDFPPGLTLTPGGLLSCTMADSSVIYDVNVCVADAGKISASKVLVLASGLEIVAGVAGSDESRLENGKTQQLKLTVTNRGSQPVQNLLLKLRSPDSLLDIHDSVFTVASLQAAQSITLPSAFSFTLGQKLPDGWPVAVSIHARSGQRAWDKRAEFTVAAPDLVFEAPQVDDGYNQRLDPGEVADLVVSLKNLGGLAAKKLAMKLVPSDTMVTLLSAPSVTVDLLSPLDITVLRYQVRASRNVAQGTVTGMQLLLSDSLGILQSLAFTLPIGKKQVALVSLSASANSMKAMATVLDSLHVGYDSVRTLLFDHGQYASIFVTLGTGSSGWHTLTVAEGSLLVSYLQKSGNLYMEGYLTWYYSNNTPLHPWFRYTTANVPAYTYQGVSGVQSTFADSMNFNYSSPLNHAVFSFNPVAPAYVTLVNGGISPKNFEIAYDGSGYTKSAPYWGSMP